LRLGKLLRKPNPFCPECKDVRMKTASNILTAEKAFQCPNCGTEYELIEDVARME
jgi:tRNA(Ile2) C34 agmatinyltransferase TiaS